MFDGTRPLCLSPQAEFQQVPAFLGQKEDETPGRFMSCTVRVSGRDSGVCAAGTHLGTVQSWGGMGTGQHGSCNSEKTGTAIHSTGSPGSVLGQHT